VAVLAVAANLRERSAACSRAAFDAIAGGANIIAGCGHVRPICVLRRPVATKLVGAVGGVVSGVGVEEPRGANPEAPASKITTTGNTTVDAVVITR